METPALETITIAYEPVWAIGTGQAATPAQAVPVHRMIRRTIDEISHSDISRHVRILYGGSVTPDNIADFLLSSEIDGALVGGACLDPACFATLLSVALKSQPSPA
jgi:triosephosphate isomerase